MEVVVVVVCDVVVVVMIWLFGLFLIDVFFDLCIVEFVVK